MRAASFELRRGLARVANVAGPVAKLVGANRTQSALIGTRTVGNRVICTVDVIRDILPFEEITVNYGFNYWVISPVVKTIVNSNLFKGKNVTNDINCANNSVSNGASPRRSSKLAPLETELFAQLMSFVTFFPLKRLLSSG
jgi:hypothetical protein